MRDPQRIKEVLDLVQAIWEKHPDLRLGQLLRNAEKDSALFYLEDDELYQNLCEAYPL